MNLSRNIKGLVYASTLLAAVKGKKFVEDTFIAWSEKVKEDDITHLELTGDVVQVICINGDYLTLPSFHPLPSTVVETYRELMSTKEWFSPCLKYLTEEEWCYIHISDDPVAKFKTDIRILELKFNILKKKP